MVENEGYNLKLVWCFFIYLCVLLSQLKGSLYISEEIFLKKLL